MAQIILVNGPFSSGKTEVANHLVGQLEQQGPVQRVVDGPHLVDLVTTETHGVFGRNFSATHFHGWNAAKPLEPHNHLGKEKESHFPFTVIDQEIGSRMFLRFARELVERSKEPDWVVAELGTGLWAGCEISQADFSAETCVRVLEEEGLWPVLQRRIGLVVAVKADWETRLKRNQMREQVADGVARSWGMQKEGLFLTYGFDSWVWQERGLKVLTFDNNQDGPEGIRQFIEGKVAPLILREGARRGAEVF